MENNSSPSLTTLFTCLKTATSPSKIKHDIDDFASNIKNIAVDDPRRIIHSLKVALAITLVSMIYYLQPFYNGMGDAGMWAILTVVVVFEYTVGKQLNYTPIISRPCTLPNTNAYCSIHILHMKSVSMYMF